ncbi:MAG TPA: ribosomal-processing cysteine protease Prp [Candidatus Dormibacteraeota bacterium]|nr:ribosomal-processing cysteine protease Prp [Candidatus Dormibacteraeota bacterium]
MLAVTFCRDSRNRLSSVFATGHAGFAEHGEDIVCAAVSAILQAARLGLEAHARVQLEASQSSGELRLVWPEAARDDAAVRAIVATAELSVEQIAAQYPTHVRFHRKTDPAA